MIKSNKNNKIFIYLGTAFQPIERRNWLIHLHYVRREYARCKVRIIRLFFTIYKTKLANNRSTNFTFYLNFYIKKKSLLLNNIGFFNIAFLSSSIF